MTTAEMRHWVADVFWIHPSIHLAIYPSIHPSVRPEFGGRSKSFSLIDIGTRVRKRKREKRRERSSISITEVPSVADWVIGPSALLPVCRHGPHSRSISFQRLLFKLGIPPCPRRVGYTVHTDDGNKRVLLDRLCYRTPDSIEDDDDNMDELQWKTLNVVSYIYRQGAPFR